MPINCSNLNPSGSWLGFPLSVAVALVIGRLVKSEPNIKGSGIPQVEGQVQGITDTSSGGRYCGRNLSVAYWQLESGLFLGREGPCHSDWVLPSGKGSVKLTKGDDVEERILLSSGAGAGLAAAFNAPLAGLMFVFEEIHHNFSPLLGHNDFCVGTRSKFCFLEHFRIDACIEHRSDDHIADSLLRFGCPFGHLFGLLWLAIQ